MPCPSATVAPKSSSPRAPSAGSGMATTASAVDVELRPTGDEKHWRGQGWSHNSWSDRSGRRSILVFGEEKFVEDVAEKRILWAERGISLSCFLAAGSYLISGNLITTKIPITVSVISFALLIVCYGCLCYNNVSFVILKRLLKELNVIFMLTLALCNLAIDIGRPYRQESPLLGAMYGVAIALFIFADAMITKSRYFVLFCGTVFVAITLYNAHSSTFGDDDDTALFHYTIRGEQYAFMRRETKRSIYFQILFFSWNGISTMLVDKSMKLMMFATGPMYRADVVAPQGQGDVTTARRLRYAQRGLALMSFATLLCFILHEVTAFDALQDMAIVFGITLVICFGFLCYNNVSVVMAKRLLKEPNVAITIVLSICNCAINIGKPENKGSPALGFVYMIFINCFVIIDSMITKSRHMVLCVGLIFVVCNLYLIYQRTLGSTDNGVVLFKYTVHGKEHYIMKRSTKRLIYLQILLLSANGIYTMLVDKPMKLMMFATGSIYKSSGTASEKNEDESHSLKVRCERKRSREKRSQGNGSPRR